MTVYKIPILDSAAKLLIQNLDTPFNTLFDRRFKKGVASIVAANSGTFLFAEAFTSVPKVMITPLADDGGARWWVTNQTINGFTIQLDKSKTISFNYVAVI